jgi:hypothetical protein
MAAAGAITLTRADPTTPTPAITFIHGFANTESFVFGFLVPADDFDPNRCLSFKKFTVKPNQKYVLFTNLVAPTVKVNGTDPLEFEKSEYRLCYRISMKQPDMAMHVGEKTPLTLLLNSDCLNVSPVILARDNYQLFSGPLTQIVRIMKK